MSLIRVLVIDDQIGRSENFRKGFLDAAKKGNSAHNFNLVYEFHSGQDIRRKNSLKAVEGEVLRGWPFKDGTRWAGILLDVRFDQDPSTHEDENFGFMILRHLRTVFGGELPIIMLTSEDENKKGKAGRGAASEFLSKDELNRGTIETKISLAGLIPDVRNGEHRLVGNSLPILKVLREARRFAAKPYGGRIIYGETGSGKTELARYIHDYSNCSGDFRSWTVAKHGDPSISYNKLFGHWKNAYTGATRSQPGEIELAHKGTFLLDEISDLSPEGQQLLIEFRRRDEIGLRTITRLGVFPTGQRETKEAEDSVIGLLQHDHKIKIDVLFISATNKDLRNDILRKEIHFREDLYADIGSYFDFPSLSERTEDISLIFSWFVKNIMKDKIPNISHEVLELLKHHNWKNKNVVGLKSVAEFALSSLGGFDEILPHHLPPEFFPQEKLNLPTQASDLKLEDRNKDLDRYNQSISTVAGKYPHHMLAHYEISLKFLEQALIDRREPTGEYSPTAAVGYLLKNRISTTSAKRVIKEIIGSILQPNEIYKNPLKSVGLSELQEYVRSKPILIAFYRYSNGEISLEELNVILEDVK